MEKIRKIVFAVMSGLLSISAILVTISAFGEAGNAILRKFFGISGIGWVEEFCILLAIFAFFLSIPYLEIIDKQLAIGALSSWLKSDLAKRILFVIKGVLVLIMMFIIIKTGFAVIQTAYESQVVTYTLRWPRYLIYSICIGGFVLAGISWISVLAFNGGRKYND